MISKYIGELYPFFMGVSKNRGTRGTPKSSILIGFSIIFTIHFGEPLFLETSIYIYIHIELYILAWKNGNTSYKTSNLLFYLFSYPGLCLVALSRQKTIEHLGHDSKGCAGVCMRSLVFLGTVGYRAPSERTCFLSGDVKALRWGTWSLYLYKSLFLQVPYGFTPALKLKA